MHFATVDELWHYALRQVVTFGEIVDSRNGSSRELVGASYTLETTDYTFLTDPTRNLSPAYAGAETLWYLSGSNRADMLMAYAPQYIHYLTPEGIAHGAYGYRWAQYNQIEKIIAELRLHPVSRRAVMTCWRIDDDLGNYDSKDLPCTLSLQFILRNKKLHLVVTMRSNDMWLGMPYDIFAFTALQRLIAEKLAVDTGTYTHNVGSLHFYKKDEEKLLAAISSQPVASAKTVFRSGNGYGMVSRALELEEQARTKKFDENNTQRNFIELATSEMRANTTMLAILLMATSKWMKERIELLTKEALYNDLAGVLPPSLAKVITSRMK